MSEIHYGRKRKGIRKALREKVEAWISSIDDDAVAKACKKDTIITGGSIASMLLGDKINDYDVYFRTKATTELVAKYYVKKFNDAVTMKVGDGVTGYAPFVKEDRITNIKGIVEDRVVIYIKSAGVAAEEQDTYRYFEMEPEDLTEKIIESLDENKDTGKPKYRPVFMSANAITLSNDLQIIIRFFGEPSKIHDNFDFVHAMSYYDYAEDKLELPAKALECLLSRTLSYAGSLYPLCSIFRVKKFLERGWRIGAGELLKIMWQISEVDLTDQETLREQLTGVDAQFLHQLVSALKDVDRDKINSTYVAALIDKIF